MSELQKEKSEPHTDIDWHEAARQHRVHAVVNKRFLSCMSVYFVIVLALCLLLVSVKWRAAPCQRHAKQVELVVFIKGSSSASAAWGIVRHALRSRGFSVSSHINGSAAGGSKGSGGQTVVQHAFLDTAAETLRDSAFQLRWTNGGYATKGYPVAYTLRYASQDLCLDRPPIIMDAEYDVDSEFSSHALRSVSDLTTTTFFFETAIRSKDSTHLSNTQQLTTAFPGLRSTVTGGSTPLEAHSQFTVDTAFASAVVDRRGNPLPSLNVRVEHWQDRKDKRSFFAIRGTFRALEEERLAVQLVAAFREAAEGKGIHCQDARACRVPISQA